jgi:MFS family permease
MILLVQERPVHVAAKSKIDINLRHFPRAYWNYLLVIENSSNSFLILQTKGIGASFEATILIYTGFNLVAALISYPAGSLSDRWGRKGVLLPSFIIFFIAYLGFARAKNVILIATLFVFLWIISGNIPFGRQGICLGLRAGAPAGQWSWLVQRERWFTGIGGQHCCWVALGPGRPSGCILLRRSFCHRGHCRVACVDSRGTE